MFQLHESSHRQIAIALFFLLCVAPTTGVIGWAIAWRLPSHLAGEREQISQALGLNAAIASMRHLSPGVVRYDDVCLSDPETGKRLLTSPSVQAIASVEVDRRGERHPALVLHAHQMTVDVAQWPKVNEALQRRLQGVGGGPELEIRFTADEFILRSDSQSQTLYRIDAGVGALPGGLQSGIQALFTCCLEAGDTAEKVRMRLVRNRQVSPPANGFEIDTGRAAFPCRLLALACRELKPLGANCRFTGAATLFQTTTGLAGQVKGRLTDLDLGMAMAENFGRTLQGFAEVDLDQAVLRGGRLDAATGRIKAGPGAIGRPFLKSAVDHLQLVTAQLPPEGDTVPFEMLSAAFWLDQTGLSLEGKCPGVPMATMTFAGRPLLGEPARQPLPVGALVQVVAAGASDSVPATREAVSLARYLPTPDGGASVRPGSGTMER